MRWAIFGDETHKLYKKLMVSGGALATNHMTQELISRTRQIRVSQRDKRAGICHKLLRRRKGHRTLRMQQIHVSWCDKHAETGCRLAFHRNQYSTRRPRTKNAGTRISRELTLRTQIADINAGTRCELACHTYRGRRSCG